MEVNESVEMNSPKSKADKLWSFEWDRHKLTEITAILYYQDHLQRHFGSHLPTAGVVLAVV